MYEEALPRGKASPNCENTQLASETSGSCIGVQRRNQNQSLACRLTAAAAGALEEPGCLSSSHPSTCRAGSSQLTLFMQKNSLSTTLHSCFPSNSYTFEYQWKSERAVNLISKGCELPSTELSPPSGDSRIGTVPRHIIFKTSHHFFPNITFQCLSKCSPCVTAACHFCGRLWMILSSSILSDRLPEGARA